MKLFSCHEYFNVSLPNSEALPDVRQDFCNSIAYSTFLGKRFMQNFKSRSGFPYPLRLSDIILFPFFCIPFVCCDFLRILLHLSLRITTHNKIMEKELRAEITPKSVPDIFRHIFKLPYLTVTCELHLQHLSLCIVPCGSDHRISQYVPSHCLLFSLSVSAFVIPDRNVLYYNAFSYIFSLKEFPLYTFT